MKGVWMLSCVLLLAMSAVAADGLVVAEGGCPKAEIVVAADASETVRYAAEELRRFLKEQTGAELPVVGSAPDGRGIRLEETDDGVHDWFDVRSEPGGDVRIRGNGRGVLYGVYELLRRFGGCEWYTPTVSEIPKLDRFVVPAGTDIREKAAFVTRETSWWPIMSDPAFALRRRMNGTRAIHKTAERGLPVRPALRFSGNLWICHTFEKLCPPAKYAKAHPEYYALNGGVRRTAPGANQLCLSNPEVLKIVTDETLKVVRAHPEADIFGVSQNDNQYFCECDRCRAIEAEEGAKSGPVIRFVNAIADRVAAEFPGKMVETLAYEYSRAAPKVTKPRDNVMVCLCTIELDFSKPIVGNAYRENTSFVRDLEAWQAIARHIYIWDYSVNFAHYPDAYPNVGTLAGNLRFFRDRGVRHVLEQGAGQPSHAWFADLKSYVISEFEWNPDQDLDRLLDRFFAAVYGKGAPFARRYYDACCKAYERDETKEPMTFQPGLGRTSIPDSFYDGMAGLWQRAAEAVKGDPVREENVRWGAYWNDYTRVLRVARDAGVFISRHPERFGAERVRILQEAARRVIAAAEENPGECYYESDTAKVMKDLKRFLGFRPPTGPCDAAIFQEDALKPPDPHVGRVVDDPLALNGKATRKGGAHYAWSGGFYLTGMTLDPGGRYAIRMRVRCDLAPGAHPEDVAFLAGVYSHTFKGAPCADTEIRVSQVKDGYAWYETHAWVPREGDFLWFSPGGVEKAKHGTSAVKDVWFDCFEVVRKD